MRTAAIIAALFVMHLVACGSVPDLQFPASDASLDASTSDAAADVASEEASLSDGAEPDVASCASNGDPCKKDRDCCSARCQGSGNLKVCAP